LTLDEQLNDIMFLLWCMMYLNWVCLHWSISQSQQKVHNWKATRSWNRCQCVSEMLQRHY